MKEHCLAKIWVIANLITLLPIPLLFILGLLWPVHWVSIFDFSLLLIPVLLLNIFYQGFFIGAVVALITTCMLLWQKWTGKTISKLLLAGEICVILLGIFDVCPMVSNTISKLYYLIPGW
jgi:hypothetical protein